MTNAVTTSAGDSSGVDPTRDQIFDEHRGRLRALAYKILGSTLEVDDAVQETRIRWWAADQAAVRNPGGWLTTVVARICLDILRTPYARRLEQQATRLPDPVVEAEAGDPEMEALTADAVGRALLIVLESLTPAERVAVVLHDSFAVPFAEIAVLLERSVPATKQLASRARRRLRHQGPALEPVLDHAARRRLVAAFRAASRSGDFEALVVLLDPEVVLRVDTGSGLRVVRGATALAGQATAHAHVSVEAHIAFVGGGPGLVTVRDGRVVSVMQLQIADGRVVAADVFADVGRLDLLFPSTA